MILAHRQKNKNPHSFSHFRVKKNKSCYLNKKFCIKGFYFVKEDDAIILDSRESDEIKN